MADAPAGRPRGGGWASAHSPGPGSSESDRRMLVSSERSFLWKLPLSTDGRPKLVAPDDVEISPA
jgi:hypothetical protein